MKYFPRLLCLLPVFGLMFVAVDAQAQSFRVQCPTGTPFHPDGKNSLIQNGRLVPLAAQILEKEASILAPDVFMTGEFNDAKLPAVNQQFAGYTFGYNRPLLANRVNDVVTAIRGT